MSTERESTFYEETKTPLSRPDYNDTKSPDWLPRQTNVPVWKPDPHATDFPNEIPGNHFIPEEELRKGKLEKFIAAANKRIRKIAKKIRKGLGIRSTLPVTRDEAPTIYESIPDYTIPEDRDSYVGHGGINAVYDAGETAVIKIPLKSRRAERKRNIIPSIDLKTRQTVAEEVKEYFGNVATIPQRRHFLLRIIDTVDQETEIVTAQMQERFNFRSGKFASIHTSYMESNVQDALDAKELNAHELKDSITELTTHFVFALSSPDAVDLNGARKAFPSENIFLDLIDKLQKKDTAGRSKQDSQTEQLRETVRIFAEAAIRYNADTKHFLDFVGKHNILLSRGAQETIDYGDGITETKQKGWEIVFLDVDFPELSDYHHEDFRNDLFMALHSGDFVSKTHFLNYVNFIRTVNMLAWASGSDKRINIRDWLDDETQILLDKQLAQDPWKLLDMYSTEKRNKDHVIFGSPVKQAT
jgi:hypothetical protein